MKSIIVFILFKMTMATVYLKTDTFDEMTSGQKSFVAFKAPWCGHCKQLKSVWDELAENTENVLIGEVDCTVEKTLCEAHGIKGYPTLKYSDGTGWKNYDGGRDLQTFEDFVVENLQDGCFDDPNLCTDEELLKLEQLQNEDLDELHANYTQEMIHIEEAFQNEVTALQSQYNKLSDDKRSKQNHYTRELAFVAHVFREKNEL